MNKRSFRYFLISLCLTTSLMLIKKWDILEGVKDSFILRNLFEEKVKKYACDNAGSRLTNKYKNGYNEKDVKSKKLSKAQQAIVDFARDSKYSNIKPYVKKLGILIFFLVLDIIFIFLWISYCSCCCCSCCLFNTAKPPSPLLRTIFFLIAAACNLLVIIFSIVVLGLINPFFKRVNGFGCSAYYFLDHVRYGLAPNYVNNQNEWRGIEGIIDILDYTNQEKNNIVETVNGITISDGDKNGACGNEFTGLESIVNTIKELTNDSFQDIDFSNEIEDLRDAKDTFDDADEDIGDDVYDILHDYINKLAKRICKLIFSLTLVFGILGLAILCLYYFLKYNVFRIVYIVIWNISMFLMLFAILFGVVFGVLGNVLKDAVRVGQYILSRENIDSNDPLIFKSNEDEMVADLIDVCANGDGNFMEIIQENGQLKENIEKWENNLAKYQNTRNNIQCTDDEKRKKLEDSYDKILNVTNTGLAISNNLTDLKCRFARNDKNIILNEVNSAGKKGVAISACSILVGLFLGISVLAGILFVHKYKYESSTTTNENIEQKGLGSTTEINESSQNIGKSTTENINNNNNINTLSPDNNNVIVNNNMNKMNL